jgi:hypothetical protein
MSILAQDVFIKSRDFKEVDGQARFIMQKIFRAPISVQNSVPALLKISRNWYFVNVLSKPCNSIAAAIKEGAGQEFDLYSFTNFLQDFGLSLYDLLREDFTDTMNVLRNLCFDAISYSQKTADWFDPKIERLCNALGALLEDIDGKECDAAETLLMETFNRV